MALKDFLFGDKQKKRASQEPGGNTIHKGAAFEKTSVQSSYARQPEYRGPRYYVLRECMTGVTEYGYFCDGRPVGAAMAMVVPGFPVRLQCEGLNLRSEFDKTLFPGVTREIMDEDTGKVYGVITGYGTGLHSLRTPQGEIIVKTEPDSWHFMKDGVLIANLRNERTPGSQLSMTVTTPVPDSLALLMLSFPLLQLLS